MPEPTAADTKEMDSDEEDSEPGDDLPPDDLAPGGGDQPPLEEGGVFVLRPQSATAVKGKDINFVTKVDSSSMARKPAMKWLKGKWLDLGSKAGKHLQFKETYDRNTKIYTYEMKIIKVVDADAGSYRCEVTVKDKVDCSPFEITVEALQEEQEDNILESFKRSGEAGEDAGDLDFSALLKKRAKKKQQEPKEEVDVWTILKAAKPCDYEKIAFEYGITDLRGMLKMLKKMKKDTEPKQTDAFLRKLEPMYSVDKGKRIQMSVELADPDAHVKWFKNGQEINPSAKYVFESVGNKRTLTINKSNLSDDAEYECVVGEEKCAAQVFVKEPPVTITKLLDDVHTVAGEKVEFEVEVSAEGAHVKWMKDGVELNRDNAGSKYRFKKDGKRHVLVINEATTEDMGMYYAVTNGGESKAELEVEEKELEILQNIADLTLKAAEQAVFKCEVSDEKVTGKWFKDGVEVVASDRIKMSHIGRIHKLTIDDVKPHDAGDYTFVPDGYALSLSAKLNFIEIKIDYVPRQDPPKIHLDTGPGNKNTIIVVAGNKLRLDVEITGEPAPTVCWKRGDTEITEAEGRVRVETRDTLSSFVMDGAERADEGEYSIMVTNPAGEDKAEVYIKIVDVPDPPENVRCTSVGEDSAVITWDPPAFDGGVPLKGYLMERKKVGSARWTKLNFEVYETTTYEAKKMIEGVLYEMRVFAVNGIGVSQPSGNSKPFMPIAPTSEPIRLMVDDVTDSTCELKWRPPERLGAGGIDGYIIEYCKEGSDQWEQANSVPVEKTHYRVKGLPTGEKMLFRAFAVNIAGRSPPATLGQGVAIREIMEQPKIWLPRNLRTKLIKKVGEKINLVIPFQGKPRPVVTWLKEDVPLEDRAIGTRTSDVDTVLFIRSAERDHSGKYTLTVQIENVTARADIHIQIVAPQRGGGERKIDNTLDEEKPGPPINVHVTDVWGFNAALEWKPPKDDGNCDIIGYMIEKADLKTKEWFTVYEHNRRPNCTVSDLVMGNEYTFRVRSENICGLSDEVGISKNTANISKTGLEHKPLPFKEQDMCHSPKFTAPLVDRCVVAGYSAAISCSVRGFPKPKIIWMKNRMIIGEDPKFLMQNNQGVLTLNIRRPGLFDGGKYTCKAVNDLGEDEVECKLEVRVIQEKGEEQKSK